MWKCLIKERKTDVIFSVPCVIQFRLVWKHEVPFVSYSLHELNNVLHSTPVLSRLHFIYFINCHALWWKNICLFFGRAASASRAIHMSHCAVLLCCSWHTHPPPPHTKVRPTCQSNSSRILITCPFHIQLRRAASTLITLLVTNTTSRIYHPVTKAAVSDSFVWIFHAVFT